jgi:predicted nuclease with TOPRIM domain
MTASTQDMRARLREMQEKYDKKHADWERCDKLRENAVNQAFKYAGERKKAQKELEDAQSESCTQKCEALEKECADLKERLHTLYEAIEINGEAVRKVAKDAWDGIDRARRG